MSRSIYCLYWESPNNGPVPPNVKLLVSLFIKKIKPLTILTRTSITKYIDIVDAEHLNIANRVDYYRANRERILTKQYALRRGGESTPAEHILCLLIDVAAAARARGITPSASDESDGSANAAPSQVWPTHQTD